MATTCLNCEHDTNPALTACESCGLAQDPMLAHGPDEAPVRWPRYALTRAPAAAYPDGPPASLWQLGPPLVLAIAVIASLVTSHAVDRSTPPQAPAATVAPSAAATAPQATGPGNPKVAPPAPVAPADEPRAAPAPQRQATAQAEAAPAVPPPATEQAPPAAAPPALNAPAKPSTLGKPLHLPPVLEPLSRILTGCGGCPAAGPFGAPPAVVTASTDHTVADRADEAKPYLAVYLPTGAPLKWDNAVPRTELWFYEGRLAVVVWRLPAAMGNATDWQQAFGGPPAQVTQQGLRSQIRVQTWQSGPLTYVVRSAAKAVTVLVADAGLYAALGPKEQAVADAEKLIADANADLDAGLPAKAAVEALIKATDLAPTSGLAWARLAKAHYRALDYRATLEDCARVRALSKSEFNLSLAAFYEGMVAVQKGDVPGTIAKLDEGIRIDPNSPGSKMRRAALQGKLEDGAVVELYAEIECARTMKNNDRITQALQEFGLTAAAWEARVATLAGDGKFHTKADAKLATKQCGLEAAHRKE